MTQTCLGMSRDDSGSFLGAYTENEIVKVFADGHHPFASIDQTGGGQLIQIAAAKGNKTRPGIKLGPAVAGRRTRRRPRLREILPPRRPHLPVARLAAAQAKAQGSESAGTRDYVRGCPR